jgi:hypothetical protein
MESIEALREKQVASGIAIDGLFDGLMSGAFSWELLARLSEKI